MIACSQVSKVYRTLDGREAGIRDVSLEARPGELVVVRGPSGCGKSTLLLAMGGMLRPDAGRVTIVAADVYGGPAGARARLRATTVGFVFQLFHLVPYLTVRGNVLAGLPRITREGEARADALLEELGLAGRRDALPSTLSAGERQRTALARALAKQPSVLLADEPTGNLDPANARVVFARMDQFRREGGTVVVVTHGPDADPFATRTLEAFGSGGPCGFRASGMTAPGTGHAGGTGILS